MRKSFIRLWKEDRKFALMITTASITIAFGLTYLLITAIKEWMI